MPIRRLMLLDGRPLRPVHEDRGYVGVSAARGSGQADHVLDILNDAGIEDPAAGMEETLIRHLVDQANAAGIGAPIAFDPDRPEDLLAWARDRGVADPIIDVETTHRGLDWRSSSVAYDATFRLIDPASGQLLAYHRCEYSSPVLDPGPRTKQNPYPQDVVSATLLADNAAPFKAILAGLAQECVEAVMAEAL